MVEGRDRTCGLDGVEGDALTEVVLDQLVTFIMFSRPTMFAIYSPLGHEFGVLNDIGRMADDSGEQNFSFRKFHILPDHPLMLMTRVGHFERIGASVCFYQEINNGLQRYIAHMGPAPASPANVVANLLRWNAFQREVQGNNTDFRPAPVIFERARRNEDIVVAGHKGIVDL